jgi:hypothetical protein
MNQSVQNICEGIVSNVECLKIMILLKKKLIDFPKYSIDIKKDKNTHNVFLQLKDYEKCHFVFEKEEGSNDYDNYATSFTFNDFGKYTLAFTQRKPHGNLLLDENFYKYFPNFETFKKFVYTFSIAIGFIGEDNDWDEFLEDVMVPKNKTESILDKFSFMELKKYMDKRELIEYQNFKKIGLDKIFKSYDLDMKKCFIAGDFWSRHETDEYTKTFFNFRLELVDGMTIHWKTDVLYNVNWKEAYFNIDIIPFASFTEKDGDTKSNFDMNYFPWNWNEIGARKFISDIYKFLYNGEKIEGMSCDPCQFDYFSSFEIDTDGFGI